MGAQPCELGMVGSRFLLPLVNTTHSPNAIIMVMVPCTCMINYCAAENCKYVQTVGTVHVSSSFSFYLST